MKSTQVAAVLTALTATTYAQFPTCATSCLTQNWTGDFKTACSDSSRLASVQSCLASSSCNDSDRNSVNSYINQACKDNGVTITSGPVATATGFATKYSAASYSSGALSAWSSYSSAHPSGFNSADWSSFTSAYGITGAPQPTGGPNGWAGGFPGGFGGGFGGFGSGFGSGPGGWSPSNGGPFGGAGYGPYGSGSAWTTGPWTQWWGGDKCPASTWSGWTSGSWSSSAPWTTWTGCTASVTGTKVYTTTLNGVPTTVSSYDYQVAQAVQTGSGSSGNAAAPTKAVGAGAAGLALLGAVLAM